MEQTPQPRFPPPEMSEEKSEPITVMISLTHALDAEAYAARIDRSPGWRSCHPGSTQAWDVRLVDRCDQNVTKPERVVLLCCGNSVDCDCCPSIPRYARWPALLAVLAEAAGRTPGKNAEQDALARLTRRELDVLRLVGRGLSVPACAQELGVAPSTVGNHKYRLMRKLGATTSLQLLRIAVRNGVVEFN